MTKQLTYRRAKHRPQAVELKGVVWFAFAWIALAAGLVWSVKVNFDNRPYVLIGKSVDCNTRPFPKALRCNPRVDGVACDEGSRNWLREWVEPIDYSCAAVGPSPTFVFSTYRDLNLDEETIEIMLDLIEYADPPAVEVADAT